MTIYVGNLSYDIREEELKVLFSEFGNVESAVIIKDKETHRSRGFGFVDMSDAEGESAIAALNGKEVSGRTLVVNASKSDGKNRSGHFRPKKRY